MATHIPKLTRRDFIRVGGIGVAGYSLLPMVQAQNVQAKQKAQPRGGAEVVIWVFLQGGVPQMDTFDVKEGSWTPDDFDIRTVRPGVRMPFGLMPKLSERTEKYTIVRSMEAWEAEHTRAEYYMQVARILSPARVQELPAIGSVIAYETMDRRRDSDFLPPYVAIDAYPSRLWGQGILPADCAPMPVNTSNPPPFVLPETERVAYERRRDLLGRLDREWREEDPHRGRIFRDLDEYTRSAQPLLENPKASEIFTVAEEDHKHYGETNIGDACAMARNIVRADAGTRFIMVNHGNNLVNTNSWDFHGDIYKKEGTALYGMSRHIDGAFSALLDDLETETGADGRPLIEKVFVVCMGEFGRTPGNLNSRKGRDHYPHANTGLFAGAGVKTGKIMGATDEIAAKVIDTGWRHPRSIYPEDIALTMYSVMGIDWTKEITQTPSGRPFQYIENISPTGVMEFDAIDELFV